MDVLLRSSNVYTRVSTLGYGEAMETTRAANKFHRTYLPGHYISGCGLYTAELRPAGFYADLGGTMHRHYAIRARGYDAIQGTARTLADAAARYLDPEGGHR